jgi:hypothetical protein
MIRDIALTPEKLTNKYHIKKVSERPAMGGVKTIDPNVAALIGMASGFLRSGNKSIDWLQ